MGPTTPTTGQILSSTSRPGDYFDRVWDDSSFTLNEYSQDGLISAPKLKEAASCAVLEQTESDVLTRHEGKLRSKGSSRHNSSINSSGVNLHSGRTSRHSSQKVMLSKALQKANTAVLLDNAQNFEGAKQAYVEACALLQQVLLRSSGEDDRRKLEAIRNTYIVRINELGKISTHVNDYSKALPARPEFYSRKTDDSRFNDSEEEAVPETTSVTKINNERNSINDQQLGWSISTSELPPRRESLLQLGSDTYHYQSDSLTRQSFEKNPDETLKCHEIQIESQNEPSLSTQRSLSPQNPENNSKVQRKEPSPEAFRSEISNLFTASNHSRILSSDSMSWLDTIDESGGSATPSISSRTSSGRLRGNMIRSPMIETEAQFDAALDAAVEAAYDDGFIQTDDYDEVDIVEDVGRRVVLAKHKILQSDLKATAKTTQKYELTQTSMHPKILQNGIPSSHDFHESDEEERMLDEMTRDFAMEDFEPGLQSKSALPRESDSSSFSGRTWSSSMGSNPAPVSNVISTISKTFVLPSPPPQHALPSPPSPNSARLNSSSFEPTSPTARNRTLLGQNFQTLRLETNINNTTENAHLSGRPNQPRIPEGGISTHSKNSDHKARQNLNPDLIRLPVPPLPNSLQTISSYPESYSPDSTQVLTSIPIQNVTNEVDSQNTRPGSPAQAQLRNELRKKFSSSSLRKMNNRNTMSSNLEDGSDSLSIAPISPQINIRNDGNKPQTVTQNSSTPILMTHKDKVIGTQTRNIYGLDNAVQHPESPDPSSLPDGEAPISLESCPIEYVLRPFWLMRAIYQTITHPKGGYISSKLFIPCDVWRVKGVKIKNIEEKITNCDLLTAALTKLARIDICDSNAVLDEMQLLETVLEQIQTTLSKKLGNDVGIQNFGTSTGLKESTIDGDTESNSGSVKSGTTSGKSSFSWRRLRSKNSGVCLSHAYLNKLSREGMKHGFTITSLPMTINSNSKIRFSKNDLSQVQFTGPNSNYMIALAKLFEAAQIIDQIARQGEDTGLKPADKLPTAIDPYIRHAAEFFGFYVCRFVLIDIAMLLDKFVKKGGEWVLA